MLANVALTAFDDFCDKYKPNKKHKGFLVRYADDFVIVCKNKLEAKQIKAGIADYLHENIGLTLSDEKSRITHIDKGFDFLGFNFRKYTKRGLPKSAKQIRDKLLITPQKEKVHNLLRDCKRVIKENRSAKQDTLIHILNPKLLGWSLYYRHVVSKQTFSKINHIMFEKLIRWSIRRHPNKGKKWAYKKYFPKYKGRITFADKEKGVSLFRPVDVPIRRYVKVKADMRVYDNNPQTIAYWQKRLYTNAYQQIYSVKMRKLFERQDGQCAICYNPIEDIADTNTDHILPRADGGSNSYSNLRLLHTECHKERHAKKKVVIFKWESRVR